jgi:hypothetical protein
MQNTWDSLKDCVRGSDGIMRCPKFEDGGYTVRKTDERAGKTHVVIGPDGTKKYFGDPSMGERENSENGKEAFYARHKKNLDNNPYFRAYAKATWGDGGMTYGLGSHVVHGGPRWRYVYDNGGPVKSKSMDGGDMPFGMPLKEVNPFTVAEYRQPMMGNFILPDPNRPELMNTGATEYKIGVDADGREIQIPTVVSGQYLGPNGAVERAFRTREAFLPMTDPGSYSKFYDMVNKLGIMKQKTYGSGGMIKRADGSYSPRGLWDNIRANRGSGKKPTKEMLEQERKIRAVEKNQDGGPIEPTPPPVKKYERTSMISYANPMNWFVPNLDNAGTFDQAFAKARNEGMDEFMWYGTRYTTDLKPSTATVTEKKTKVSIEPKGLTNDLLIRQAFKESSFNPKAKSPAGYMGLAQIGEDVINDYMKATGEKNVDPYNPKHAVKIQKWYMNDLYNADFINKPNQSEQVRMAKALASYNYGRGDVFNHLKTKKAQGYDIYNSLDWMEGLPKETTDYVNKILLQKDPKFEADLKKAMQTSSIPVLYKANGSFIKKGMDTNTNKNNWLDNL